MSLLARSVETNHIPSHHSLRSFLCAAAAHSSVGCSMHAKTKGETRGRERGRRVDGWTGDRTTHLGLCVFVHCAPSHLTLLVHWHWLTFAHQTWYHAFAIYALPLLNMEAMRCNALTFCAICQAWYNFSSLQSHCHRPACRIFLHVVDIAAVMGSRLLEYYILIGDRDQ